jgi:hypothetical protein
MLLYDLPIDAEAQKPLILPYYEVKAVNRDVAWLVIVDSLDAIISALYNSHPIGRRAVVIDEIRQRALMIIMCPSMRFAAPPGNSNFFNLDGAGAIEVMTTIKGDSTYIPIFHVAAMNGEQPPIPNYWVRTTPLSLNPQAQIDSLARFTALSKQATSLFNEYTQRKSEILLDSVNRLCQQRYQLFQLSYDHAYPKDYIYAKRYYPYSPGTFRMYGWMKGGILNPAITQGFPRNYINEQISWKPQTDSTHFLLPAPLLIHPLQRMDTLHVVNMNRTRVVYTERIHVCEALHEEYKALLGDNYYNAGIEAVYDTVGALYHTLSVHSNKHALTHKELIAADTVFSAADYNTPVVTRLLHKYNSEYYRPLYFICIASINNNPMQVAYEHKLIGYDIKIQQRLFSVNLDNIWSAMRIANEIKKDHTFMYVRKISNNIYNTKYHYKKAFSIANGLNTIRQRNGNHAVILNPRAITGFTIQRHRYLFNRL